MSLLKVYLVSCTGPSLPESASSFKMVFESAKEAEYKIGRWGGQWEITELYFAPQGTFIHPRGSDD